MSAKLLWIGVEALLAAAALYVLLRRPLGERHLITAVLPYVLHWLVMAAVLLLPVALVMQRWPLVMLSAVHLAICAGLFGEVLLPRRSSTGQRQAAPHLGLRVMTYNLGAVKASPAALVQAIRTSTADIVALQELGPQQAEALRTHLRDEYPYQHLHDAGISGIGLLSRHPIEHAELFHLALCHPYQRARINVNGVPLEVFNAHPPPQLLCGPTDAHGWASADIPLLVERLPRDGRPYLLLGDFNITDQNADYLHLLRLGLVDAYRTAGRGMGFTFPARPGFRLALMPLYRIDYVWHTPHFTCTQAHIGPNAGSDHLPVVADLLISAEHAEPATLPEPLFRAPQPAHALGRVAATAD